MRKSKALIELERQAATLLSQYQQAEADVRNAKAELEEATRRQDVCESAHQTMMHAIATLTSKQK